MTTHKYQLYADAKKCQHCGHKVSILDDIRHAKKMKDTNKPPKGFTVRSRRLLFNGLDIGACYREIDGDYVFWPDENKGFITANFLRIIADVLDHLNQETK